MAARFVTWRFYLVCLPISPLLFSFGSIKSHLLPYKSSNTATVPYAKSCGGLTNFISLLLSFS